MELKMENHVSSVRTLQSFDVLKEVVISKQ